MHIFHLFDRFSLSFIHLSLTILCRGISVAHSIWWLRCSNECTVVEEIHQPLPRDAIFKCTIWNSGTAKRMTNALRVVLWPSKILIFSLGLTLHIRWALCLSIHLRSITVVIKRPTRFRLYGMEVNFYAWLFYDSGNNLRAIKVVFFSRVWQFVPVRGRRHPCPQLGQLQAVLHRTH